MKGEQTDGVLKTEEAIQSDFFIPDAPVDDGREALSVLMTRMKKEIEEAEWKRKFEKVENSDSINTTAVNAEEKKVETKPAETVKAEDPRDDCKMCELYGGSCPEHRRK